MSVCMYAFQYPRQPAVSYLLSRCGCWRKERVGLCVEQVWELWWNPREIPAPTRSVLHHRELAAPKVMLRNWYIAMSECVIQNYITLVWRWSLPCLSCRYLEYTLDPKKTHLMDVAYTIISVANNAVGHALAWNFIRAHWEHVKEW